MVSISHMGLLFWYLYSQMEYMVFISHMNYCFIHAQTTQTVITKIQPDYKNQSCRCSAQQTHIQSWWRCGFAKPALSSYTVTPLCFFATNYKTWSDFENNLREYTVYINKSGVFRNRKSTCSVSSSENRDTSSASVRCQERNPCHLEFITGCVQESRH